VLMLRRLWQRKNGVADNAADMQDDLRKMIERLLNQKRGPIRKGPAKRKGVTDPRPTETEKGGRRRRPRQIGIDVGPFPDSPKRPRPRTDANAKRS
jgi:hypothetical protein